MNKNNTLIRISEYYKIDKEKMKSLGVLDAYMNYDIPMYVNPKLLKNSCVKELENGEKEIISFFEKIILYLIKTNKNDGYWKALKKMFSFKEPSGIGLGTSLYSTDGRGLTGTIAKNSLVIMKEIVDLGVTDPEMYKLLFLIQENVGVDRISDMICRILYKDLELYTNNMIEKLEIKKYYIQNGLKKLKRPNNKELILLPTNILSDIPLVIDRNDIIECSNKNLEIKEYLCEFFSKAYVNITDLNNASVQQINECVMNSKDLINELLINSSEKPVKGYDYKKDDLALFTTIDKILNFVKENSEIFEKNFNNVTSLKDLTNRLLETFKFSIENLGINEELYSDNNKNKIRREQVSHKLFIEVLETASSFTRFQYDYEPCKGNGKIEFVLYREKEKVLVEFKLSTNDLVHGYDKQLPEYIKRFKATYSYYVIINVTTQKDIDNFYKKKTKIHDNCKIVEIDGTIKPSPSKM